MAVAGAALLGVMPTLSASPELMADTTYYVRGTNIGDEPTDAQFTAFMGRVFTGTGTTQPGTSEKIPYDAGLWPFSKGGLGDLTWNASVREGVGLLEADNTQDPIGPSDVVFGFSQGAVVASKYKGNHPSAGATYVLVENPSRPNGGVMQRFEGLSIPILNVTFSGATPDNGDPTIDIARQYSGWSDFPTYPLNLLAVVNSVAGIYYLHGRTQRELTAQDLIDAEASGDPDYYQQHGNTTYYVIKTERLPILMPFTGIVPEPILDATDAPLRSLIETGYDRTDYNAPTRARLFPKGNPLDLASPRLAAPHIAPKLELRQRITTKRPGRDIDKPAGSGRSPSQAIRSALRAVTPKAPRTRAEPASDSTD